jgi:hypothetical protein
LGLAHTMGLGVAVWVAEKTVCFIVGIDFKKGYCIKRAAALLRRRRRRRACRGASKCVPLLVSVSSVITTRQQDLPTKKLYRKK